jgi:anthranilate synthase component 1
MGASPETLVRVSEKKVETHPIAGTRPLGRTREEERRYERQLKRSIKEKAEHLMLVDLARNDLGRIARPGSVRLGEYMELKRFPGVMHLVSRVEAELRDGCSAMDALKACFPAGTLTGAPKIRAMQILSSLEPKARGEYGGAVVVAGLDGSLDTCITIRSLVVRDGLVHIQAGAGVVLDSDPAKEYQEVLNKTRAARQALGYFESAQRPKTACAPCAVGA